LKFNDRIQNPEVRRKNRDLGSGTSDFRLKAVGFQTVRKYDETEERSQNPGARRKPSKTETYIKKLKRPGFPPARE
jgi:hypothetical protein